MNEKQLDDLIKKALEEDMMLPDGLSDRLEQQIHAWSASEKQKKCFLFGRDTFYWLSGIAATVLLCIGIFQFSEPFSQKSRLADTYTNPKEAALVAQKALLLMSVNLNKGIKQAEEVQQELKKVNQILDTHLNNN